MFLLFCFVFSKITIQALILAGYVSIDLFSRHLCRKGGSQQSSWQGGRGDLHGLTNVNKEQENNIHSDVTFCSSGHDVLLVYIAKLVFPKLQ